MSWAQQGHFSPELREARRLAYKRIKDERESRRCNYCQVLFKTLEEKESHERQMQQVGMR